MPQPTPQTDAFWHAFLTATGTAASGYTVVAFGDSPEQATKRAELVVAGPKRPPAALARDYGPGREPLPKVGDYVVVVDGQGAPRCIWRTTQIEVKPLNAVDAQFAWDEGEGDRSREWWLSAHRGYFWRCAAREKFKMHDAIETVFER